MLNTAGLSPSSCLSLSLSHSLSALFLSSSSSSSFHCTTPVSTHQDICSNFVEAMFGSKPAMSFGFTAPAGSSKPQGPTGGGFTFAAPGAAGASAGASSPAAFPSSFPNATSGQPKSGSTTGAGATHTTPSSTSASSATMRTQGFGSNAFAMGSRPQPAPRNTVPSALGSFPAGGLPGGVASASSDPLKSGFALPASTAAPRVTPQRTIPAGSILRDAVHEADINVTILSRHAALHRLTQAVDAVLARQYVAQQKQKVLDDMEMIVARLEGQVASAEKEMTTLQSRSQLLQGGTGPYPRTAPACVGENMELVAAYRANVNAMTRLYEKHLARLEDMMGQLDAMPTAL